MKSIVKKIMVIISVASAVNPAFVSAGWWDSFVASAQENKRAVVASLSALVVAGCSARALSVRNEYKGMPALEDAPDEIEQPEEPQIEASVVVDDDDLPELEEASEDYLRARELEEENRALELANFQLQIKAGQDNKVFNIVADQLEDEQRASGALRKKLRERIRHAKEQDEAASAKISVLELKIGQLIQRAQEVAGQADKVLADKLEAALKQESLLRQRENETIYRRLNDRIWALEEEVEQLRAYKKSAEEPADEPDWEEIAKQPLRPLFE